MPRKILIVDDNEINRLLLKNTLCEIYDVLEAKNGKEALSLLHRNYKMLSAVLLDIVMPEMDGYEVLRKIRDNAVFSPIPVVMVTGAEDEESRVKALSLGANDFIRKPFNPEIVKHCLKNNIALRETASILNAIQKDKLTGLYNREAFFERVTSLLADRAPGYYILSCFDIDNFKLVNDQYGAAEGDRILREVGRAVGKNADELGGIAGRISADNFAALFPAEEKMTEVLRRILDKSLVCVEQRSISFSVGRYVVTDLSLPASAIYDRAFIAKQSIKGRYDEHLAYFDDAMLQKLVRDQQITGEMETALRERQFEVWFQPQYNHATGALLGAEALVRWRHPQKGVIAPGEFIPLFEQNGFVYELDKYVWDDVCRYLQKWRKEGRPVLPVSVNISRYDIFRADLIDTLSGLVKAYDIPAKLLRLEITESAFTSSMSGIVSIVKQLIALGFTVEIDDFGSGYSSLNTLKNVPAQVVKLDMKFLDGGEGSHRGGSILEAIVRMAKWLGMTVLAEGVEEAEQADFLKSIGCAYVQGYLYARPMPASEFEALLDGAVTERRPAAAETLPPDAFWDPKSIDSLVFNRYSGGACVYEFHDGQIELIRITDQYIHTLFGPGMTAADAMRLDWTKHIDSETNAGLTAAIYQSIETREDVSGEYRFLDLPGCPPETYLRTSLRVIASTDDRHLVYCTSVNITPQREAERRELAAAQRDAAAASRLQAVMDHVDCGITAVTYDDAGGVEYLMVNDRYLALLGYTKEQYEGLKDFQPIHADDRQRAADAARAAYKTGKPITLEFRVVRRDGSVIWMRDSLTITHIAGIDKPVQLSMFSDITKERQAARELLDNLPGGAALFEYDGKSFTVVHINKRYWELVDRAPVDYAELSIHSSIHPEDKTLAENEVASAIRQNRDIGCDLRVRAGKDGYRPFHIEGHVVPKGDGRYFINAIYFPISDERLSLQQMLPAALRAVMDSSSEISFVKDADLRYISCSHEFAVLAGYESERELLGKTSADVFPPDLAEKNTANDREVLRTGRSYVDIDLLFPTKDDVRRLLFSKYPLLDTKGNVLGVYGTGRDVTEAREAQSRLELLTNSIPGGIAVYEGTPDTLGDIRLTYFSDGLCRLFGYTRPEYAKLAEKNPLGLVFSADVPKIYEKVTALARGGGPMDYIYRARANGGAYKWINVKAVLGEPSGDRLTVNAVFFDVTELKTALDKLRVSEEINRLAIEQSRNVVCLYDIATKRLSVSPNANPIFEAGPVQEDIPERTIREKLISPDTVGAYTFFYESILRGEKSGKALFQRRSTQGWRWLEAHSTTIFSEEEPITAVITYTDITESIEKDAAYKKWQQSLRDRSEDSYSLYHCNVSKNTLLNSTEGRLISGSGLADGSASMEERTAQYADAFVVPEDRERFLAVTKRGAQLQRFRQGRKTDSVEYRERLPDGGARWLRLTADLVDSPYSSDVEAYLLFENIDEAKRAELEILARAQTDPLTGVLNRRTFAQQADRRIEEAGPAARHALLLLDIDGFKLVNDVFGHGMGDRTLIDIAELLRRGARRGDLVGRLGGDEFLVFLPDIPGEEAAAKKARQICELTRRVLSAEVRISGSVGIALCPQDGRNFDALYQRADEILYDVKGTGKDSYAFYRDGSSERHPAQLHPASLRPVRPRTPAGNGAVAGRPRALGGIQGIEMSSYQAALERAGTLVIVHDWLRSTFAYSAAVSKTLSGRFDGRSLWRILLSDLVADSQTVQRMQQLVHAIANDRQRADGCLNVRLKAASGKKTTYEMNVYKQIDDYGLATQMILTLREIDPARPAAPYQAPEGKKNRQE